MPPSEAQKRAAANWKAKRDQIVIRPSKEQGAMIRAAAAAAGLSITQYILKCVAIAEGEK